MFKPVTPDAPNRSNRNPPTRAPTIPSAMLSQKPWPCLSTILLPINPAIRPSMIQLRMPIFLPPFRNAGTKNSGRFEQGRDRASAKRSLGGEDCQLRPEEVDCRLQLLRRWSHDEQNDEQVLSRGSRPCGAFGSRSRRRAHFTLGSGVIDRGQ